MYNNGLISLDEYNDKSSEYRKEIRSATSDVKDYQDSLTRTVSIDCFVAVLTNGQVILYTLFAKKDTLNILRHMHIRRLKSQGIL